MKLEPIKPFQGPEESFKAEVSARHRRRFGVDLFMVRTGATWTLSVGPPYWNADLPREDFEAFAVEVKTIFAEAIDQADDVLQLIEDDHANE